jgi:hypothetical protein
MFIARDRNYELKNRGINWHAVPFPSDYHYDNRLDGKVLFIITISKEGVNEDV